MRDILWWAGVLAGGVLFAGALELVRAWRGRDKSGAHWGGHMAETREYGRRW